MLTGRQNKTAFLVQIIPPLHFHYFYTSVVQVWYNNFSIVFLLPYYLHKKFCTQYIIILYLALLFPSKILYCSPNLTNHRLHTLIQHFEYSTSCLFSMGSWIFLEKSMLQPLLTILYTLNVPYFFSTNGSFEFSKRPYFTHSPTYPHTVLLILPIKILFVVQTKFNFLCL